MGSFLPWLEAAILGVVQGLTEFLPVSSSAHLRILGPLLPSGTDPGAAFTAITQLGTEAAVLVYFRHDIARILVRWWGSLTQPALRGDPDARMGWLILIGTLPIAVLGLLFKDAIETSLRHLAITATMLIVFALLPSWGMSNAAATMVGQALGANDPERAERAVWRAAAYNTLFLTTIGLLFVIAAAPIVGIFTGDPLVVGYAVDCLRTVSYGFLLYAGGMVLTQAFNGAGDTWTPTVLNLLVFWVFEIPLAYVLAKTLNMGPHGVFLAITISFSALTIVSAIVFRLGRWKRRKV